MRRCSSSSWIFTAGSDRAGVVGDVRPAGDDRRKHMDDAGCIKKEMRAVAERPARAGEDDGSSTPGCPDQVRGYPEGDVCRRGDAKGLAGAVMELDEADRIRSS